MTIALILSPLVFVTYKLLKAAKRPDPIHFA